MDRDDLLQRVRAARARTGKILALRDQADDQLGADLAAEQATTLTRLGHRLDLALAALGDLEARAVEVHGEARVTLVTEHGRVRAELLEARWEMIVVREAMGLSGVRRDVDETWPVPPPLR